MCGRTACLARGDGGGGVYGKGACTAGGCMAGAHVWRRHAWQERWPLQQRPNRKLVSLLRLEVTFLSGLF